MAEFPFLVDSFSILIYLQKKSIRKTSPTVIRDTFSENPEVKNPDFKKNYPYSFPNLFPWERKSIYSHLGQLNPGVKKTKSDEFQCKRKQQTPFETMNPA